VVTSQLQRHRRRMRSSWRSRAWQLLNPSGGLLSLPAPWDRSCTFRRGGTTKGKLPISCRPYPVISVVARLGLRSCAYDVMRGSAWASTKQRKQDFAEDASSTCGGAILIRRVVLFVIMACRSLPDLARCRVSGCFSDELSLSRVRHEMNGTAAA
jgi:hypothetical protein